MSEPNKKITKQSTSKKSTSTSKKKDSTSFSFNYKFKVDEFAMRGLNKYKNFMKAPDCDCGCGDKMFLTLDTEEDLYKLCGCMLYEYGCPNSAIFIVYKDGTQKIILSEPEYDKDNDDYEITGFRILEVKNVDDFAQIDAGLRLCCYGLMIERDKGWEICE